MPKYLVLAKAKYFKAEATIILITNKKKE